MRATVATRDFGPAPVGTVRGRCRFACVERTVNLILKMQRSCQFRGSNLRRQRPTESRADRPLKSFGPSPVGTVRGRCMYAVCGADRKSNYAAAERRPCSVSLCRHHDALTTCQLRARDGRHVQRCNHEPARHTEADERAKLGGIPGPSVQFFCGTQVQGSLAAVRAGWRRKLVNPISSGPPSELRIL